MAAETSAATQLQEVSTAQQSTDENPLRKKWDAFSPMYAEWMQFWSLPLAAQLFTMLGVTQPRLQQLLPTDTPTGQEAPKQSPPTLLDVGCGPGLGTQHAFTHLPDDWHLAAVDLSPEMVTAAKKLLLDGAASRDRIQLAPASAEELPFADNSMAAVMSNLCLMLVPHPEKAFAEIRRVLRPGEPLAFSVWGDSQNSPMFTLTSKVLAKHGVVSPPTAEGAPARSNFDLARDEAALKRQLQEAGFQHVLMWHSCAPVPAITAEHAAAFRVATSLHPQLLQPLPACLTSEQCAAIQADLQEAYTPLMESGTPLALDVLIVVAR